MVTQEVLAYIIGIVGTISAIVFGVIAYKRNNKTDNESKGKENGMMYGIRITFCMALNG